jgi:hypothetical protein
MLPKPRLGESALLECGLLTRARTHYSGEGDKRSMDTEGAHQNSGIVPDDSVALRLGNLVCV